MSEIFKRISGLGIVPVVKIEDAKDAVPLAKALNNGGLPIAEITFRTAAAEDAIKAIHKEVPEVLLGAGTVLTVEQVKKAVGAGAEFIVAPGLNPEVVSYCIDNNIPITPGISNPTDIEAALSLGLKVLKFFPAEAAHTMGLLALPIPLLFQEKNVPVVVLLLGKRQVYEVCGQQPLPLSRS